MSIDDSVLDIEKMIQLAREGITKSYLVQLSNYYSLPIKELAELLPISMRSIQRYEEEEKFKQSVSIQIIIIGEVLKRGEDIFDNLKDLNIWLHSRIIGLDRQQPITLLDTPFGADWVLKELGRLEHGVYS